MVSMHVQYVHYVWGGDLPSPWGGGGGGGGSGGEVNSIMVDVFWDLLRG